MLLLAYLLDISVIVPIMDRDAATYIFIHLYIYGLDKNDYKSVDI